MKRTICLLALLASPALADEDACFELGGQGIAPCATPQGRIAYETNLVDWQREGKGDDRTDTLSLGSSVARIGVGAETELRLSGTPLILTRARGKHWTSHFGDLVVGVKHQFGHGGPVAFALQAVAPTAGSLDPSAAWGFDAIIPAQFPLSKAVTLDLTGTADVVPDEDGHGSHFAASIVGGFDIALADHLTATADVKRIEDYLPGDRTHATSASLSLGYLPSPRLQLTIGGVAGLDHAATTAEAYLGLGYLF